MRAAICVVVMDTQLLPVLGHNTTPGRTFAAAVFLARRIADSCARRVEERATTQSQRQRPSSCRCARTGSSDRTARRWAQARQCTAIGSALFRISRGNVQGGNVQRRHVRTACTNTKRQKWFVSLTSVKGDLCLNKPPRWRVRRLRRRGSLCCCS